MDGKIRDAIFRLRVSEPNNETFDVILDSIDRSYVTRTEHRNVAEQYDKSRTPGKRKCKKRRQTAIITATPPPPLHAPLL